MTGVLDIFLNERRVGALTLLPDGRIVFSFEASYTDDPQRPVLSQSYFSAEGDLLTSPKTYSGKAPPFFSNLLPEGQPCPKINP